MKKINKLFLLTITFLAFVLASCKIGLGEALDLEGPDVEITSPTMRQSVRENFTITGTAYDNNDVKRLTVTVDDNEWKNEDGVWTFKARGSSSYVPYADATWEVDTDKNVKWQIRNVNITSGRKLLTAVAVDGEGNTSANSQKIITIFFDNDPPKVTITSPNIRHKEFDGIKNEFSAVPDYKQLQVVNKVLTGGFKISGVTKDDSTVNYVRLFVKKVDKDTGEASDFIEKNLVLADSGETFVDPISNDTLRSWEVDITDADLASLGNDKQYLQIATQASDNAGNKEVGIDVHGYVLLWKKANNPWVEINLSDDESDKTKVYSGASAQGTAFDNEQAAKVTLTINKKNGSNWEPIEDYNQKEIPIQYDNDDLAQASSFKFNYPAEVAEYQVVLKATDTKGNTSSEVTGYIDVQDMSFPSVRAEVKDQRTLPFGNAAGDITINVTALDDTKVEKVMYKICTNDTDKVNYSDKSYSSWSSASPITCTRTGTETDESGYVKEKYDGTVTLNLFTNLNVAMSGTGKRKLEQTTIIFYVEDGQGNKSVTKFVLAADTTPPTITLTNIGGVELKADGSIKTGDSLPAFDKDFEIYGKWGDDSFNVWKSLDASKAPKIEVTVRGNSTSVTMKENGTWSANVPVVHIQDSGSAVGAIDIKCSITDIGGSTTVFQKGYQVDTDTPKIEYTSCDLPSGTYPAGKVLTINLHFNREVVVSGTPTLTLSNNKTATYSSTSGKVVKFTYTVADGDDTTGLQIKNASFGTAGNTTIKAKDRDLYYENSSTDFANDKTENKTMGKSINILTSTPTISGEPSWHDTKKELTIVFNGDVTANSGTITITQDESSLLAPACLTKDEYNNMPSDVQKYYEEGTLGADKNFYPDLTTKYILKYETNTDDKALVEAYKKTGSHKRSVNILSEKVTRTLAADKTTTTFVLTFGALPCKGASYTFDIPAGLVKNAAGTTNAAKTGNAITNVTGTETPVIRIKKPQQVITGASGSSAGTVDHALNTTFKIDCRTPGASLKYSYDCLVATKCAVEADGYAWGGESNNINDRQEEWQVKFTYNDKEYYTNLKKISDGGIHKKPTITPAKNGGYSKDKTNYAAKSNITIGQYDNADIDYKNGLTYQIAAYVGDTDTAAAYEVAYRTTLVLANYTGIYNGAANANYGYWPKNNNVAIFIRGSDNLEGANSTSGLPGSWNINEKDKIVMLKQDGNDFYFTTWNITVDKFYHQPLAGICDSKTNTAGTGNNQGPAYSIFQQDNIIFSLDKYPIGKGEYMEVWHGGRYDLSVPGKVMKHR